MSAPRPAGAAPPGVRRIPDFGYDCPTAADAIASLTRVLDAQRATTLWQSACARAGVHRGALNVHIEDLARVSDELIRQGGAVGIVGNAFRIRLRTFQRLAARTTRAPAAQAAHRAPTQTDDA